MSLPLSGTMLPKTAFENGVPTGNNGLPSFCSKSTRSCSLIIGNSEGQLSATDWRWFTEDQVEPNLFLVSWPTIDLIVPSDWKGQLVINNNDQSSTKFSHRTVIVPFNGDFIDSSYLYSTLSSSVISLPSMSLNAQSASHPILFNGVRGGQFNTVNMKSVSGGFIARGATFAPNSVVNIDIPMGDIIISENQKILTTVKSL